MDNNDNNNNSNSDNNNNKTESAPDDGLGGQLHEGDDLGSLRRGSISPSTISTVSSEAPLVRANSAGGASQGRRAPSIEPTSIAAAQLQFQQRLQQQQQQQQHHQQVVGPSAAAKRPSDASRGWLKGGQSSGRAAPKPAKGLAESRDWSPRSAAKPIKQQQQQQQKEKQDQTDKEKSFAYDFGKSIAFKAYSFNRFWSMDKLRYLNFACLFMIIVCLATILLLSGGNPLRQQQPGDVVVVVGGGGGGIARRSQSGASPSAESLDSLDSQPLTSHLVTAGGQDDKAASNQQQQQQQQAFDDGFDTNSNATGAKPDDQEPSPTTSQSEVASSSSAAKTAIESTAEQNNASQAKDAKSKLAWSPFGFPLPLPVSMLGDDTSPLGHLFDSAGAVTEERKLSGGPDGRSVMIRRSQGPNGAATIVISSNFINKNELLSPNESPMPMMIERLMPSIFQAAAQSQRRQSLWSDGADLADSAASASGPSHLFARQPPAGFSSFFSLPSAFSFNDQQQPFARADPLGSLFSHLGPSSSPLAASRRSSPPGGLFGGYRSQLETNQPGSNEQQQAANDSISGSASSSQTTAAKTGAKTLPLALRLLGARPAGGSMIIVSSSAGSLDEPPMMALASNPFMSGPMMHMLVPPPAHAQMPLHMAPPMVLMGEQSSSSSLPPFPTFLNSILRSISGAGLPNLAPHPNRPAANGSVASGDKATAGSEHHELANDTDDQETTSGSASIDRWDDQVRPSSQNELPGELSSEQQAAMGEQATFMAPLEQSPLAMLLNAGNRHSSKELGHQQQDLGAFEHLLRGFPGGREREIEGDSSETTGAARRHDQSSDQLMASRSISDFLASLSRRLQREDALSSQPSKASFLESLEDAMDDDESSADVFSARRPPPPLGLWPAPRIRVAQMRIRVKAPPTLEGHKSLPSHLSLRSSSSNNDATGDRAAEHRASSVSELTKLQAGSKSRQLERIFNADSEPAVSQQQASLPNKLSSSSSNNRNMFTSPDSPLFGFPANIRRLDEAQPVANLAHQSHEAQPSGKASPLEPVTSMRQPRAFTYRSNHQLAAPFASNNLHQSNARKAAKSADDSEPTALDRRASEGQDNSLGGAKMTARQAVSAPPASIVMGRRLDDGPTFMAIANE